MLSLDNRRVYVQDNGKVKHVSFGDYTKNKEFFRRRNIMFRFFQPEKTNDAHYTVLMNDLHQTAQDLQDAYRNLENVIDPDMIDCCIYELYSVQMRYKFLLASIKKIEDSYTKNPLEVSKS
jgi:hypothetical protein